MNRLPLLLLLPLLDAQQSCEKNVHGKWNPREGDPRLNAFPHATWPRSECSRNHRAGHCEPPDYKCDPEEEVTGICADRFAGRPTLCCCCFGTGGLWSNASDARRGDPRLCHRVAPPPPPPPPMPKVKTWICSNYTCTQLTNADDKSHKRYKSALCDSGPCCPPDQRYEPLEGCVSPESPEADLALGVIATFSLVCLGCPLTIAWIINDKRKKSSNRALSRPLNFAGTVEASDGRHSHGSSEPGGWRDRLASSQLATPDGKGVGSPVLPRDLRGGQPAFGGATLG